MVAPAGERRLERTVLQALTGRRADLTRGSRDRLEASGGWLWGRAEDYKPELALDPTQLWSFLSTTQITTDEDREVLDLSPESPSRQSFLAALHWEISFRGVVDVMQRGMTYESRHLSLFYGISAPPPYGSLQLFRFNRFSVTPRLRYSQHEPGSTLDLCLFVNGLPVVTLQLADGSERTTQDEAIQWYRNAALRDEPLFERGRCLAHFAVDDERVSVCADLREAEPVFVPFNTGATDDTPNPARLFGVPTEYLWRRILTRRSVTDLIENYARIVTLSDDRAGRERQAAIFPRYHQLDLVRQIVDDIDYYGVGRRYLIQHAAGSGKSQTMVWLVSQLIDLEQVEMAMFGTVIVVTDRPASERWLQQSIRQFSRLSVIVDARQGDRHRLEEHLESPHRIIIADVGDLAFILDEIKVHFHGSGYAIVIDETGSPRAGASVDSGSDVSVADQVNLAMTDRELMPNASYFVFTAAPDDRTLEVFGQPVNDLGVIRYRPFHQHGLS